MKFLLLRVALLVACSSSGTGPTQEDLQNALASAWQAYSVGTLNFGGGLAMQILLPRDDYFISTGMGTNMDNSYRSRPSFVTNTAIKIMAMLGY